MLIIIYALS